MMPQPGQDFLRLEPGRRWALWFWYGPHWREANTQRTAMEPTVKRWGRADNQFIVLPAHAPIAPTLVDTVPLHALYKALGVGSMTAAVDAVRKLTTAYEYTVATLAEHARNG